MPFIFLKFLKQFEALKMSYSEKAIDIHHSNNQQHTFDMYMEKNRVFSIILLMVLKGVTMANVVSLFGKEKVILFGIDFKFI